MLQAVRANKQELQGLVRDLDPDAIPVCEAPDLWKEFTAIARLAESAATLLARRVEEGDTWRKGGFKSAADQMAQLSGTSISTAKRQSETSKKVKKLTKTANAMRKGKLSPAKVDAIAGAADVDPDAEDTLLHGAENKPLAQLREECLKAKAKDRDKTHARIRRERYAREYKDAEGAWNFHARGTIDDGARSGPRGSRWSTRSSTAREQPTGESRSRPTPSTHSSNSPNSPAPPRSPNPPTPTPPAPMPRPRHRRSLPPRPRRGRHPPGISGSSASTTRR